MLLAWLPLWQLAACAACGPEGGGGWRRLAGVAWLGGCVSGVGGHGLHALRSPCMPCIMSGEGGGHGLQGACLAGCIQWVWALVLAVTLWACHCLPGLVTSWQLPPVGAGLCEVAGLLLARCRERRAGSCVRAAALVAVPVRLRSARLEAERFAREADGRCGTAGCPCAQVMLQVGLKRVV